MSKIILTACSATTFVREMLQLCYISIHYPVAQRGSAEICAKIRLLAAKFVALLLIGCCSNGAAIVLQSFKMLNCRAANTLAVCNAMEGDPVLASVF